MEFKNNLIKNIAMEVKTTTILDELTSSKKGKVIFILKATTIESVITASNLYDFLDKILFEYRYDFLGYEINEKHNPITSTKTIEIKNTLLDRVKIFENIPIPKLTKQIIDDFLLSIEELFKNNYNFIERFNNE